MLKGFEEDFAGIDLPDEVKTKLIEAANKRASGLVTKNDELLSKLSVSKSSVTESQGAVEKLAALEALQAQQELENKQNYDAALSLNSDKFTKQIDELINENNSFKEEKRNTLIGKGITDELTKARVNPLYLDLVNTQFKSQAQLTDGKVMVGDISLSDAIQRAADINKRFGKTG